jgi:AcrR family transcriptional regulator
MGVRERRDREREARREAILEAARVLFVAEGYRHVSIRRIADRVELSPAAIYGYFPSKDEIFYELAGRGFRLFHRALNAGRPCADPLDRLRQRYWRYYQFSKAQPEYFALMFVDRAVPQISRNWERLAFLRPMRTEAESLIRRAIDEGQLPSSTDPAAAFHLLATAAYGAAVIRLSDRFCPPRAADQLARDVIAAVLEGLRHGVPTTFRAGGGGHHLSGCDGPARRDRARRRS